MSRVRFLELTDRLIVDGDALLADPGWEAFRAWLLSSDELLEKSRTRVSLAPWTLSHELARLVLAEQLYRAGTIVRGEPYHK